MNSEQSPQDPHVERIDADAVCAECGTVNPEDTLLCKTCGNNLRDQRARRAAAETAAAAVVGARSPFSMLGILFAVFFILVTLWAALNMGKIERWLVEVQAPREAFDVYSLWEGPDRGGYEELLADLRAHPVTNGEALAAVQQGGNVTGYAGRYILVTPGGEPLANIIGYANVRQEEDTLHFVAELNSGSEVRGTAEVEAGGRPTARDTAGVRVGYRFYLALGVAHKQDTGGYECYVHSGASEESYKVLAYRVP